MNKVFDAFAWFEYFFGTLRGEKVRPYVDNPEVLILTPAIALYEIKNKLVREDIGWKKWVGFILERSIIADMNSEIALIAVDVRNKHKLKTSDAFIYTTALVHEAPLVSGDRHFKGLKNVELI
jgi:predicted nucleic acid-binding protein